MSFEGLCEAERKSEESENVKNDGIVIATGCLTFSHDLESNAQALILSLLRLHSEYISLRTFWTQDFYIKRTFNLGQDQLVLAVGLGHKTGQVVRGSSQATAQSRGSAGRQVEVRACARR